MNDGQSDLLKLKKLLSTDVYVLFLAVSKLKTIHVCLYCTVEGLAPCGLGL
jgi:hypothetical protein